MKKAVDLRIVHICTYLKGGAGTAAFRIHEALLNEKVDSNFLCLDTIDNDKKVFTFLPIDRQYSRNIISRAIRKLIYIYNETFNQITIFKSQYQAIRHLLVCENSTIPYSDFNILNHHLVRSADIIHLHWVSGLLDYPSFFSKINKPIVWTFHDMNPIQGIFHYKDDELRNYSIVHEIDKKALIIKIKSIQSCKLPIKIVSPSQWLTSESQKSILCNKLTINTIPYPINFDTFQKRNKKFIRESHEITEDEIVLLFACQAIGVFRKGFDLLLEALKTITNKAITLFVIGKEEALDIKNLKIRFTGTISDNYLLSEYYSISDAFIIPSREDNLPNVMIESLSCGTPVIGFPVGGIKEHIIKHLTGILAKEISSSALADAINEFIENKHNFESDKIRDYALSNFNNANITADYLNIYHSLFSSHSEKIAR